MIPLTPQIEKTSKGATEMLGTVRVAMSVDVKVDKQIQGILNSPSRVVSRQPRLEIPSVPDYPTRPDEPQPPPKRSLLSRWRVRSTPTEKEYKHRLREYKKQLSEYHSKYFNWEIATRQLMWQLPLRLELLSGLRTPPPTNPVTTIKDRVMEVM